MLTYVYRLVYTCIRSTRTPLMLYSQRMRVYVIFNQKPKRFTVKLKMRLNHLVVVQFMNQLVKSIFTGSAETKRNGITGGGGGAQ